MTQTRLQKVMAQAGIASRRKCEEIIAQKRVTVDGVIVTTPGTKVDPSVNKIEVDEKPINRDRPIVVVMNKPRGIISSVTDPEGRETVISMLKDMKTRIYPVGRLDYNTSGVLLLTNDGELANALTHPSKGALKKYMVKFHGVVSDKQLTQWRSGVVLEDGTETQPVVDIARVDESDEGTWVHVVLKEGKNRQIRRMAEATNMLISKLKRVSFADIPLDGIPIGRYRLLTPKELDKLTTTFDLTKKDWVNYDPIKMTKPRRGKGSTEVKNAKPKRATRQHNRTSSERPDRSKRSKQSERSRGSKRTGR